MNFKPLYFLISLLVLSACSAHVNNLSTAEGTFNEGLRLMDDEFYEEARKQFYRIKTEFPNSQLQAQADLKIADSYFEEEAYPTSAETYEEFVRMYPGHSEIPYAIYRAGLSYVNQMPSHPQRDSRSTEKAIDTFTRLLVDFPSSEYASEADDQIQNAQDQLAQKSFQIARFYERQDEPLAAAGRFEKVYRNFPDHELAEEAFARQIKNLLEADQTENIDALVAKFEATYPNSKHRSLIEK